MLRVEVSVGLQVILEVRGRAGISLAPGLIKILVFSVRFSSTAVKELGQPINTALSFSSPY